MTSARTPEEPDATRRMPPMPEEEAFSSSAHHRPPQPSWEDAPLLEEDATRPYPAYPSAEPYPMPAAAAPYEPTPGALPPQHQDQYQQEREPRRRSGGCLGVVLTLCLAIWASLGSVLVLSVWAQASFGSGWATAVQSTINGVIRDVPGFAESLVLAPLFLVASGLCVVAAFMMPSPVGVVRGVGGFLLVGAVGAYAGAVILELSDFTGQTVARWQAFGELWPSVAIADVILVPFFFLAALVCVLATTPRKR